MPDLSCFDGTDNPRHLRVIEALLARGELSRESVDTIAGASNGPQLMADLSDLGLTLGRKGAADTCICCERCHRIDRDGRTCRPGFYLLTPLGRQRLIAWRQRRPTGALQS